MNAKELKSTKLYKEYSLEIPYEEIDIEVDNKINQILPTVNIPGFRKGKAPLNIVKKKYEDNVLNEVIQKVIDINTKKLIEEKKFSSEDFAKSHPAGELGKKLTTYVGDLAISGNKVPCIEIDSSIKDTIIEITSKKLGMALVVNNKEVVGIFTDGDLRRALNQEIDIENNSVSSVMTKKFISISENDLAIDAATLMEKNKIFTLNVLNHKKQPSVITMHQLLEFGII